MQQNKCNVVIQYIYHHIDSESFLTLVTIAGSKSKIYDNFSKYSRFFQYKIEGNKIELYVFFNRPSIIPR